MGKHLSWHLHKKTLANVAIGCIRMLLSLCTLTLLNSKEKTQPRMICATFNVNLCSTIISCYCPTNASDEINITTFFDGLSSLAQHIPKHNISIISRDMDAQIGRMNIINLPYTTCQIEIVNI